MSPSRTGSLSTADVTRAFDEHAESYDRMVAANHTYHEHLRLSAQRMGLPDRGRGLRLLDLGCGTGASTAALLHVAPVAAEIIAVDGSKRMLDQAMRKNWPSRVRFVHADVLDLRRADIHGPFDGIFAAYLLRNLPDPDVGLQRFYELLRPGAPLAIHEYSVRDSFRARMRWTAVCWGVIIPLAKLRTGSTEIYRYLWRSVREFDGVRRLTQRMRAAGFDDIRVQTVGGWQQHIVHTLLGRRPSLGPVEREVDAEGSDEAPTPPTGVPEVQ